MGKTGNKYLAGMALLLFLSFGLRVWGIGDSAFFVAEEASQIPAAKNYVLIGQTDATYWHHPPLGMLLLDGSIKLFGDNPYGWRIRNLVLGSLMIALVFFVAWELFSDMRVALAAGLLLALDPLHILLSRATFDEIPAVFFFLLSAYMTLRYLKGKRSSPAFAGVMLGCSLASKWYSLFGMVSLLILTVWYKTKDEGFRWDRTIHLVLVYCALPLTVLILSYLPWFGRGYDIREFFRFQVDAYRDIKAMTYQWFANDYILRESGLPWEWFVRPRIFGLQVGPAEYWSRYIIFMGNPPVWLLTWPALLFLGYRFLAGRDRCHFLFLALFASAYFPLLAVSRPIFIYSAVTVLPFALMAVAYSIISMFDKIKAKRRACLSLLVLLMVWSAYVYPLATRREVPASLYEPFLSNARIFRVF